LQNHDSNHGLKLAPNYDSNHSLKSVPKPWFKSWFWTRFKIIVFEDNLRPWVNSWF
ncbi:21037_t:CDS:1, partial [Gigaspora rosea]